MEESNKQELYNKLLQIAEKYKDTEILNWHTDTKEDIEDIEKENNDQFCLNLTTVQPPHPGSD